MRTSLVLDTLKMALWARDHAGQPVAAGVVHHSDAGSQYTSFAFNQRLIADRVWRSKAQLELAVVEYIARFNHDRLHESLGDIPPPEHEDLYARRARAIRYTLKRGAH